MIIKSNAEKNVRTEYRTTCQARCINCHAIKTDLQRTITCKAMGDIFGTDVIYGFFDQERMRISARGHHKNF